MRRFFSALTGLCKRFADTTTPDSTSPDETKPMDEATAKALKALTDQLVIILAGFQAVLEPVLEGVDDVESKDQVDAVGAAVQDVVDEADENREFTRKDGKGGKGGTDDFKELSARIEELQENMTKMFNSTPNRRQVKRNTGPADTKKTRRGPALMGALSQRAAAEYLQLQDDLAEAYSVDDATRTFAVEPTHAQELNDQITERVDFLGRINVIGVTEIKGEKVLLGLNGPATGRTDTDENDRIPRDLLDLKNNMYELFSTETDVSLKFATIDAWAKFPEFARKYLEAVQKRIALDRILIGWNGVKVEKQTNRTLYPLLQDVNKGWLQQARELIPEQVLKPTDPEVKIKIGKGGDYENLDAAVHDVKQMIDPVFRDEGDLIAIIGSDLLAHDKGKLYAAQGQTPTEKERIENAR